MLLEAILAALSPLGKINVSIAVWKTLNNSILF